MDPPTRLILIPTNITAFTVSFSSSLWAQHPFSDDGILFYISSLAVDSQFNCPFSHPLWFLFTIWNPVSSQYSNTNEFFCTSFKKIDFDCDMLKLQKSFIIISKHKTEDWSIKPLPRRGCFPVSPTNVRKIFSRLSCSSLV